MEELFSLGDFFGNPGDKLKGIAGIYLVVSIVVYAIVFLFVGIGAGQVFMVFICGIPYLLLSAVTSFLIYGFGHVIVLLENINNKLSKSDDLSNDELPEL